MGLVKEVKKEGKRSQLSNCLSYLRGLVKGDIKWIERKGVDERKKTKRNNVPTWQLS